MTKFIIMFFSSGICAFPISLGLGLIYFICASFIVNRFGLNRGERPIGFKFLNGAVVLTFVTYLMVWAFLLERFL